MLPRRPPAKLFLVVFVLYAAALVTATHWPKLQINGPVPRSDLFIHLGAFSVWTVLLGLSGLVGRSSVRLVCCAALYVVVDETTQPLFGRTLDRLDLVANFGGVLIGLMVVRLLWARFPARGGA